MGKVGYMGKVEMFTSFFSKKNQRVCWMRGCTMPWGMPNLMARSMSLRAARFSPKLISILARST